MSTAGKQVTETPENPSTDPVPRKRLNDMQMGRIYQGEDAPMETAPAAAPDDSEGGEDGSLKASATSGEAVPADTAADPGDQDTPANEKAGTEAGPTSDPAGAVAGPTSEAVGDETGERKFRHKTLEDAEKSYAHAQAKLTKLAQENAQLKKKEEAWLKAEADTRAKEQAAAREQFTTQKYEEAMAALSELDEYDPEYKTHAAKIWADCHSAINNYTPGTPAETSKEVSPAGEPSSAPAGNPSDSAGLSDGPGETGEPADTVDPEDIRNRISGRMAEQGVTDAEFTLEDPVFFGYASKAPAVDDTGAAIAFEDQVDWAIEQTRTHYQKTRARLLQQAGQPMGRAGSGAAAGSSAGGGDNVPRRVTLNSAIERAQTRRTLT